MGGPRSGPGGPRGRHGFSQPGPARGAQGADGAVQPPVRGAPAGEAAAHRQRAVPRSHHPAAPERGRRPPGSALLPGTLATASPSSCPAQCPIPPSTTPSSAPGPTPAASARRPGRPPPGHAGRTRNCTGQCTGQCTGERAQYSSNKPSACFLWGPGSPSRDCHGGTGQHLCSPWSPRPPGDTLRWGSCPPPVHAFRALRASAWGWSGEAWRSSRGCTGSAAARGWRAAGRAVAHASYRPRGAVHWTARPRRTPPGRRPQTRSPFRRYSSRCCPWGRGVRLRPAHRRRTGGRQ